MPTGAAFVSLRVRHFAASYDERIRLKAPFGGFSQNDQTRFPRASLEALNGPPFPPFCHRPCVDTEFSAQRRVHSSPPTGHCCAIPCRAMDRSLVVVTACAPCGYVNVRYRSKGPCCSHNELVPECFAAFMRKNHTIKPWDQTPRRIGQLWNQQEHRSVSPKSTDPGVQRWDFGCA